MSFLRTPGLGPCMLEEGYEYEEKWVVNAGLTGKTKSKFKKTA